MQSTYAVCDKCDSVNRVHLNAEKAAICGSCKSALSMSGAIVEGRDKNLIHLINKSPLPVVVDVCPKLASDWGIRGIPTLLIFKNGREVTRQSGAIPSQQFVQWLDQNTIL